MTLTRSVIDWTTDFDYLDSAWTENPYPIWDDLRSRCPIAHTGRFMGAFLPTRYDDIRAIAQDTEHFSSRRVILREGRPTIPPAPPLTSDPPEHQAERNLLKAAFTSEAVKRLEPRTRAICRELLSRLSGERTCDGAADYAQEIPTRVIAYMLGVSEDNGSLFRRWVQDFLELGIGDEVVLRRTWTETHAFFAAEIRKRSGTARDDLISRLLQARLDGRPLSEERLCGTLMLLLFAGIDTTWSAIGASLWHLATHPDDRRRLATEPELIPTAVEEFLRAYAPVTMAREVVKETEIRGCRFREGEMVLLAFPAANRDPEKFPNADCVVIDRTPNPHVAFGIGGHRCLGAGLATMEMTVALEEWLKMFPEFTLARAARIPWSKGPVRGPRQLPLLLAGAA